MQPHWIEPEPLGDAQRAGLMRVSGQNLPARYDPRLIQQQIWREQQRLRGTHSSGLHKAVKYGACLVGGAVGVFALVKAGQYLHKKSQEAEANPEDMDETEESLEEDPLEPDMDDGEPVEVESLEVGEVDED